ncbi:hypothetical protein LTS18_001342, partial [Coniosporium uncinatum]
MSKLLGRSKSLRLKGSQNPLSQQGDIYETFVLGIDQDSHRISRNSPLGSSGPNADLINDSCSALQRPKTAKDAAAQ